MYVCLCMGIDDRAAREAIRAGASTVRDVLRACGSARPCGGCSPVIRVLLHQASTADETSVIRIDQYREAR